MSLFVTNEARGRKEEESDAIFWEDLLSEPAEPFTQEGLDRWKVDVKDNDPSGTVR